ncbi:hypothetical protein AGIG_G21628 [Arapaima gigas]
MNGSPTPPLRPPLCHLTRLPSVALPPCLSTRVLTDGEPDTQDPRRHQPASTQHACRPQLLGRRKATPSIKAIDTPHCRLIGCHRGRNSFSSTGCEETGAWTGHPSITGRSLPHTRNKY